MLLRVKLQTDDEDVIEQKEMEEREGEVFTSGPLAFCLHLQLRCNVLLRRRTDVSPLDSSPHPVNYKTSRHLLSLSVIFA